MNHPPASPSQGSADFAAIDRDPASLDRLAEELAAAGAFRPMLDALLLKARLDLGLPLVRPGSLLDYPEPARTQYEERYVEAIRRVGGLLLGAGELAAAWAYFRAIGEKAPVVDAIDAFRPALDGEDPRLGEVIEVALGQGVHPVRGFDLVLDHHGTCSALTAFDSLPTDEPTRRHAATRLARRLHADLLRNLKADLARRGEPEVADAATVQDLIADRPDLFGEHSYHLDISHLGGVVRLSPILTDPGAIADALALAEYGRRLDPGLQPDGDPPFDDHYADHVVYLKAVLGIDQEAGIGHFRSRLIEADPDFPDREAPIVAQALVRLLDRIGRPAEAFEVAARHLAAYPDAAFGEPGWVELGCRIGRLDRIAELARSGDDPVRYAAVRLEQAGRGASGC